jgi:hypothetical protein
VNFEAQDKRESLELCREVISMGTGDAMRLFFAIFRLEQADPFRGVAEG